MKINWIKTKKKELEEIQNSEDGRITVKEIKIHKNPKTPKRKTVLETLNEELANYLEACENKSLCTDERFDNHRCPFCDAKMITYTGKNLNGKEVAMFYECSNHCEKDAEFQDLMKQETLWMFNKLIAEQRQQEVAKKIERMLRNSYGGKKAEAMYEKIHAQLEEEIAKNSEASNETIKMMDKYDEMRKLYGI